MDKKEYETKLKQHLEWTRSAWLDGCETSETLEQVRKILDVMLEFQILKELYKLNKDQ